MKRYAVLIVCFSRCVTNSAFGFTLGKMICLGFVHHPDYFKGKRTVLESAWLLDRKAIWTIGIGGNMVLHTHRNFR